MDDLVKKIKELRKSLLSLKQPMKQDQFVPTIKPQKQSFNLPKVSGKVAAPAKLPGGLPPPSKKDPVKVAQQLKNPRPGKVNMEVLKVEDNGQWSLIKDDNTKVEGIANPAREAKKAAVRAPVSNTEGFKGYHSPEQDKLIHGLEFHNAKPMSRSVAGGAKRATNPDLKRDMIVKRASDHANQDLRGHLDNNFNSAKREVLFHNMARDYFGMGKHVPTTAGFSRGGEDYSAQAMVDNAAHHDLKGDDSPLEGEGEKAFTAEKGMDEFKHENHGKILKKLHESGDLHKLALMDNLMGHHDRHGGNYMMDKEGDGLHLVDNGTAFDYKNFDTNHYPSYLKDSGNPKIKGMGLDNTQVHPEAAKWLQNLDPEKAKEFFSAHGHDENSPTTQGFLRRLQGMKNAVAGGPKHYKNMESLLDNNRLTTGPLYPHPKQEPQW